MPKNRHFTFGDMQAQKARDERLAKLRAIMNPTGEAEAVPTQPAPVVSQKPPDTSQAPVAAKATKSKSAAKKAPAKKAAAKKNSGKK